MLGPNHILVTLRWDDGRFLAPENVLRRFLNRYNYLVDRVFLGKCSEFIFFKMVKWCLGVSEPTQRLDARITA